MWAESFFLPAGGSGRGRRVIHPRVLAAARQLVIRARGCGGLQRAKMPRAGGCMNLAGIGARAAPASCRCLSQVARYFYPSSLPLRDVAVRENQAGGGTVSRASPEPPPPHPAGDAADRSTRARAGGQGRSTWTSELAQLAAVGEREVDGDLRITTIRHYDQ